jgi:cytochrome bd-type quinol oxidase subunit 2
VVGFGNVLFYNKANATASSRETRDARQSIILWLLAVLAYAIASIFVLDGGLYSSSWMRVFYIAVGFVVISLYTLIGKSDS